MSYTIKKNNLLGPSFFSETDKKIFLLFLLFFFLWYVFNYFCGEKIPVAGGIGWDGSKYFVFATEINNYFLKKNFDSYYIQRIFPSLIIHISTKISRISPTPLHIINAFYIYNCIVITIAIVFLYKIAKFQNWSFNIFILGFISLFLNFAILKHMTYYPILTDYTAFTLGLMQVYFYLKNNTKMLIAVTIIGAFTFPTILFCGCILILFPMRNSVNLKHFAISIKSNIPIKFFSLAFASIILIIALYYAPEAPYFLFRYNLISWDIVIAFLALYIYTYYLIKPFLEVDIFNNIILYFNRTIIVILLLLLIKVIQLHFSKGTPILTTASFIRIIFNESVGNNPLVFLISHFVYFGPSIALIVIYWNELVAKAKSYFGIMLLLIAYVILSLDSESRQLINVFPIFVFLLLETLNIRNISKKFIYWVLIISLFLSKFWLPINIFTGKLNWEYEAFLRFPLQIYFMNLGPWMNTYMYVINLITFLAVIIGLWIWKIRDYSAIMPSVTSPLQGSAGKVTVTAELMHNFSSIISSKK